MEEESILESINKLCQKLKGTPYEQDALEAKREIKSTLEYIDLQNRADGALEDFLNSGDD